MAIHLALDIAEWKKWPMLFVHAESWGAANALWQRLRQWKQSSAEANSSGLLHCNKTLLPNGKTLVQKYGMWMLMRPRMITLKNTKQMNWA